MKPVWLLMHDPGREEWCALSQRNDRRHRSARIETQERTRWPAPVAPNAHASHWTRCSQRGGPPARQTKASRVGAGTSERRAGATSERGERTPVTPRLPQNRQKTGSHSFTENSENNSELGVGENTDENTDFHESSTPQNRRGIGVKPRKLFRHRNGG